MVKLGAEFLRSNGTVPEDLEGKGTDPGDQLLMEIRAALLALPRVIERAVASQPRPSTEVRYIPPPPVPPAPAPVVISDPDLADIVTAVNGLKPGATADDIGRAVARNLVPPDQTGNGLMVEAMRELIEKIDFRLQGVGRAFGSSGPSNISDNANRQLGIVSISGTSSAQPVDFSQTVAVTSTAVQLASHPLTNGCIVQALMGNTATNIKVGFTNSPTYELQPGQATSCAVPNTNDIWINGTSGDGVCVIGS